MTTDFHIRPLNNEADAKIIAGWFYDFWKTIPPYLSLEQEFEGLKRSFQSISQQLPISFVCYHEAKPVGVICAGKDEMFTGRSDLTPWVTSTFVIEDMRGKGVASRLLEELHKTIKHLGFEQIYVTTREAAKLYESNGYQCLRPDQIDNVKYDILRKDLS